MASDVRESELSAQTGVEIEFLIRRINAALRKHGTSVVERYGITPVQFHGIMVLRHGPITMGEMCSRLGLACSTVTGLVDKLEAAKLVRRVRSQQDRRVVLLELEETDKAILREVLEERGKLLSQGLHHLSANDIVVTMRTLEQLWKILTVDTN